MGSAFSACSLRRPAEGPPAECEANDLCPGGDADTIRVGMEARRFLGLWSPLARQQTNPYIFLFAFADEQTA